MLHHTRTWAHFALILIAILLSISVVFAQDATPEPVGMRPDAPTYALHGPYWVGAREFTINPDSKRPIDITVWYPALNPKGLVEKISYPFALKFDMGLPADWRAQQTGHALLDAMPDMATAPYPLVIFSHGFGMTRQTSAYLTEHLASYGFVVIAPEHIETWDPELSGIGNSFVERPMDVQKVIVYAETLTKSGGALAGLLDINQIAVAGHSAGAYTALVVGGGRFDTAAFNTRCKETPPEAPFATLCKSTMSHESEMATLAGYDSVPEGFWPSWGDPRVKAVVSLASPPAIQEKGLNEITVPVLALVGTTDSEGWGLIAASDIFKLVGSSQKALITFANAEHNIFMFQCKDVPDLVQVGLFGVCSDPVWEMDRAHDLFNHFTTAFLLDVLKGDKEAHKALAPDAVSFVGVEYQAQGFQ